MARLAYPLAWRKLSGCSGAQAPGPAFFGKTLMRRRMFLGKIHRATVTGADLDYEGSVTIDTALMEAAGFVPFEEVHIWNVTRGSRLVTYVLPGPEGVVCVNGAAAHHNRAGDLVILARFGELDDAEARTHAPQVVFVDQDNRMVEARPEVAGPQQAPSRAPARPHYQSLE